MRLSILALACLAACSTAPNHLGNPLMLPVNGITTAVDNAGYATRRGQVEVFVKTNHPDILSQIAAGGGASVTRAMDLAGIPDADRPARLIQLRADLPLYQAAPAALITALMVYGA